MGESKGGKLPAFPANRRHRESKRTGGARARPDLPQILLEALERLPQPMPSTYMFCFFSGAL